MSGHQIEATVLAIAQQQGGSGLLDLEVVRGARLYRAQSHLWFETIPKAAMEDLVPTPGESEPAGAYAERLLHAEGSSRLHKFVGAAILTLATAIQSGRVARPIDELDRSASRAVAFCDRLAGMVDGVAAYKLQATGPAVAANQAKRGKREERALKFAKENLKNSKRQTAMAASEAASDREMSVGYLQRTLSTVFPGGTWPPEEWPT
ncbi:MAG: hypothetical protein Q8R98_05085 [Rubrivivax sp.]|nr:hypothetical protein [Rubrivivax sp.]MDP3611206.1 hypothetical protein [Rubrivivax sp.]